jgi:hypothetical protein
MKACSDFVLNKLAYSCHVDTPPANTTVEANDKPMNTAQVLAEFQTVFHGIGVFPGECNVHTDPDKPPFIQPPRRVPLLFKIS